MKVLTAAQAAEKLGVSVRRVQQLVQTGRLPASVFGGALMIQESDLTLVAERKPGRPKGSVKIEKKAAARKKSGR
jgi:excisionase family DNA binding protein